MTANMYRVGDYVYFETSSTSPYQIRRIEELNKTASGNVEAKVMCFYRRRDLPSQLIQLADKHQYGKSWLFHLGANIEPNTPSNVPTCNVLFSDADTGALDDSAGSPSSTSSASGSDSLTPKQRHQMKHRELFLSRQVETLPATHIRGKCSVTLLNETESLASYLGKDDMFFYCLVFDPTQKTLLADKGEIRVGSRYQCDVRPLLKEGEQDDREMSDMETLVWTPEHGLTDRQIDQFLVVSRSVGTFARALDCSSSVKQPSLHMSAAAASRDVTLFHAMDTLHRHGYDLAAALCSLVPSSGPVLCRDEMEEWSASEANLFEEALDKYGKDFNDIRNDFLPWKTLKNIIEYYYMWKTTDRYVQQKRVKAVEAESKLKQVYIPNYNKPNSAALSNSKGVVNGSSNGSSEPAVSLGGKSCESCNVAVSSQWYAWGPSHMQCRLCQNCWQYWKKYGGLKVPTRFGDGGDFDNNGKKKSGSDLEDDRFSSVFSSKAWHRCNVHGCGKEFKLKSHLGRHYATAHGIVLRAGSPRPIMKTRTAFYLYATPLTRISRRLCRHVLRPRHAARAPFYPINVQAVKQECSMAIVGKSAEELKRLLVYRTRNRGNVTHIADRLGSTPPSSIAPAWLLLTRKENMPKPERIAFPKPPKAADGSLLYERVPSREPHLPVTPAPPPHLHMPHHHQMQPPPPAIVQSVTGVPDTGRVTVNNMVPGLKRRAYDEMNGIDSSALSMAPVAKRPSKDPLLVGRPDHFQTMVQQAMVPPVGAGGVLPATVSPATVPPAQVVGLPRHIAQINGKPKIAHMTRTGSGRKQVISWMDAPDDVFFRATETSKKLRKQLTSAQMRRAARKPWREVKVKLDDLQVVVLD